MTPPRPRLINAPWMVPALIAAILAAYAAQSLLGSDAMIELWGFSPASLRQGRWNVLFTALFLHGSWMHAGSNCAFALAFGSPVGWRMGETLKGAAAFFGFYLLCGVLGNLAYAGLHVGGDGYVVGASGAIAGLMGAASRLMGPGPELAAFNSRPVIGMAASWVLINAVFGAVLVGWAPGAGGAPIAWEVHLAGYAIGLFLISPTLRLIGRL